MLILMICSLLAIGVLAVVILMLWFDLLRLRDDFERLSANLRAAESENHNAFQRFLANLQPLERRPHEPAFWTTWEQRERGE
jgi:hypothetical protein